MTSPQLPPAEVAALALAAVTVLLALRLNYLEQKGTERMAGFDAGSVVDPLDYKFEAFVPGCNGTIREPSDRQIADYLAGIKGLVKEYQDKLPPSLISGGTDAASLAVAVEDLDPEIVVSFHDAIAGLFAELCSGQPSKADILGLPPRTRAMFYQWLQQEVMSPEAAAGGGNAQARTLRSVAAG